MAASGFALDRTSQLKQDKLDAYKKRPVSPNLSDLPAGVPEGGANWKAFRAAGITTQYQLFGKFLSFKDEHTATQALCNAFYKWLASIGVSSYRQAIVLAVAERCNDLMPGLFVPSELDLDAMTD